MPVPTQRSAGWLWAKGVLQAHLEQKPSSASVPAQGMGCPHPVARAGCRALRFPHVCKPWHCTWVAYGQYSVMMMKQSAGVRAGAQRRQAWCWLRGLRVSRGPHHVCLRVHAHVVSETPRWSFRARSCFGQLLVRGWGLEARRTQVHSRSRSWRHLDALLSTRYRLTYHTTRPLKLCNSMGFLIRDIIFKL